MELKKHKVQERRYGGYCVVDDPYEKVFDTREEAIPYAEKLEQVYNKGEIAKAKVSDILKKIGLTEDEFATLVAATISVKVKLNKDGSRVNAITELKCFGKPIDVVKTNSIHVDTGDWGTSSSWA